ncbi:hypothetical protein [Nocardia transvalensis]|uniref:hypothetical protein n=1 Tax=Nocardia transvalensis TaxID=37333 RepID=UPI0018962FA5|nr:hypothetical protein [Nocardia transvalensis]MBF6331743.1 hypothetical protein [Nocardia transvalensis]
MDRRLDDSDPRLPAEVGVGHAAALVDGLDEGTVDECPGLPVMEEIRITDGKVHNPSFTNHLDPHAPDGPCGTGEPPTLSATPATIAAIRNACRATGGTGTLTRVPIRPEEVISSC